jgi:hypothetical protein
MKIFLLALFLVPFFCQAKCKFEQSANIIKNVTFENQTQHLVSWDFSSQDVLRNTSTVSSTLYSLYKNKVKDHIDISPYSLLQRDSVRMILPSDYHNVITVLSDVAGTISKINCLESLLLNYQIQRSDDFMSHPTEFLAYYLVRNNLLKVFLYTNNDLGIRKLRPLIEQINNHMQRGWKVIGNIHNHNFFLDNFEEQNSQGTLAPSGSDVQMYKSLSMEELPISYITNGFHTLKLGHDEFELFRSHSDYL